MPSERTADFPRPSRVYLPKTEPRPATILDYLIARFHRMQPEIWRDRVARGVVWLQDGTPITHASPYQHGVTVFYQREVADEPEPVEDADIVYRDDQILVADKPHGMVVSPAGDDLERSLLVRLQRRTRLGALVPMHRLDRETAGLVLFSVKPETRGAYHQLFPDGRVDKEYLALARVPERPARRTWRVENRLEPGQPWYRQRIAEGSPNAVTEIDLVELRSGIALFRIRPRTGKTHQIRLHMLSIGFPILGDPLYPDLRPRPVPDRPLRLLARRLAFLDPVSGESLRFASRRRLSWPSRAESF